MSQFGDIDLVHIEDEIADVAGVLNVANARLVRLTAQALATGEWQGHRIHSPSQWLALRSGVSPERARQIVAVAQRSADFPMVMAAFERGELTLDQAAVVVTKAPAWADSKVLDFARVATVVQLRRTMRSEYFDSGPFGDADEAKPAAPDDRLSTGNRDNGRWTISGELGTDDGATIDAALTDIIDEFFRNGHTGMTKAEAMVEMAQRHLDNLKGTSRRDRSRVWWHLDAEGNCAITSGWRIADAARDQILCDAIIQPVWERDGVPISVGRAQRVVPERTRRTVMRRDRGCRVPGCCNDRFLDVHHIKHWIDGGTTDTFNLVALCRRHHRMHHRGQLGISGNADEPNGLVFTDVRGRVIASAVEPAVPTAAPPRPPVRYRPPEGTPINRNWLGLSWIHPDEQLRQRALALKLATPPPAA